MVDISTVGKPPTVTIRSLVDEIASRASAGEWYACLLLAEVAIKQPITWFQVTTLCLPPDREGRCSRSPSKNFVVGGEGSVTTALLRVAKGESWELGGLKVVDHFDQVHACNVANVSVAVAQFDTTIQRPGFESIAAAALANAPLASAAATTGTVQSPHSGGNSGAEKKCEAWLIRILPTRGICPKGELQAEAQKLFEGLSGASFIRAWGYALGHMDAAISDRWSRAGRRPARKS